MSRQGNEEARRPGARSRALLGGIATAAATALLAAAPALAADRHAAPAGAGTACTAAEPCDLVTAVNSASDGDVVHVAGGVYPLLNTNVNVPAGVTVVGDGGERPKISFGSSGTFKALVEGAVSGLDLSRESGFAAVLAVDPNAIASRMRVESSGTAVPVELEGLLRDSLVEATGTAAVAVAMKDESGHLHNVTARAAGDNAAAIRVSSTPAGGFLPCGTGMATLRNVIARAQHDLHANGVTDCPAKFDVGHSNYRPGTVLINGGGEVIDSGGNQTAVEPLLGPDGLHQLAGSPTIDAGVATAQSGPFDFDGEARLLGSAPDIGADEFPPPSPPLVAPDTTAPAGSALRLTPRRFLPARRPPRAGASASRKRRPVPRTSRARYRLDEEATVRFTVKRSVRGVRRGKRCLTGKAARRKVGKRCRKLVAVGAPFSRQGLPGANSFRFAGYVQQRGRAPRRRMRALGPGAYRLVGMPSDAAGNRGGQFGAPFTIARP